MGEGAYADSYRVARCGPGLNLPLVVYIGGSIREEKYEARRDTEPDAVAKEFFAALGDSSAVELLVCPFPPPSRTPEGDGIEPSVGPDGIPLLSEGSWQSLLRKRFKHHLMKEVMEEGSLPPPSRMTFVGFSAGAYLAVGLAMDMPAVRGAAVFGGVGMAEAVVQSPEAALKSKRFLAIAGTRDKLSTKSGEFTDFINNRGGRAELKEVLSEHSFQTYAKCGAVREAFKVAIEIVR